MALCKEQLFENITPVIYDSLAEKVKEETGVVISGLQGEASAQGYTIAYRFDPGTDILSLQCTDAPRPERWFPSKIEAAIAKMVQDSLPTK
jgi:hypothetical protein